MKLKFHLLILSLISISCLSIKNSNEESDFVSFISLVDIKNATKDGIYMNGYVVEIEYDKIEKLNGKKVKITGETILVIGIGDQSNKSNNELIHQSRSKDIYHIVSPKIEIINQ